jgi:hypothetical protein
LGPLDGLGAQAAKRWRVQRVSAKIAQYGNTQMSRFQRNINNMLRTVNRRGTTMAGADTKKDQKA